MLFPYRFNFFTFSENRKNSLMISELRIDPCYHERESERSKKVAKTTKKYCSNVLGKFIYIHACACVFVTLQCCWKFRLKKIY